MLQLAKCQLNPHIGCTTRRTSIIIYNNLAVVSCSNKLVGAQTEFWPVIAINTSTGVIEMIEVFGRNCNNNAKPFSSILSATFTRSFVQTVYTISNKINNDFSQCVKNTVMVLCNVHHFLTMKVHKDC